MFSGNALSCKETFSLLYYEFDAATRDPPPWEPDSYKLIGRIAAGEGRFNINTEVVINTEVKSIPTTKRGVYFAFRDQGACISLLAIKVYYITCPAVTINFARFPATPTGREVTVIEEAIGSCVDNAEIVDNTPPRYWCKGDGKWNILTGACKCKPGFEPDFEKQTCNVCPHGKYKSSTGDGLCESCPPHSKADDYGLSECRCNSGYYRAPTDLKNMACTQPPTAPQNLSVNFMDQSTVILSWNPPQNLGGRNDIFYRIECDACGTTVQYIPSTETFNDTRVTISGLSAVTTYRLQVFAENPVSKMSRNPPEFTDITVTTEQSVHSLVSNVRVLTVKATEIVIAWDPPSMGDDAQNDVDIVDYEVRCFPRNYDLDQTNSTSTFITKDIQLTISGLKQKTEYGIQVRAKTSRGAGEFTPVIYKSTGQMLGQGKNIYKVSKTFFNFVFVVFKENSHDVHHHDVNASEHDDAASLDARLIAGGATVAVVLLLVVIIIMTVMFLRSRQSDECNKLKQQPGDCDALEYRNGEGKLLNLQIF